MKRVLALLLVLALLVGLVPAVVAAGTQQTRTDSAVTVEAQELEGVSRLEEMEVTGKELPVQPLYAEDEMVTVIVQLEDPAIMDYYGMSTYALDADEDLSAGEAVSAFLTSEEAQEVSEMLLEEQEAVLEEIGGLQPATFDLRSNVVPEVEVVAQWTNLLNGMAIRIPYGQLEFVRNLDGVKRAYVEHTYERPEEPATTGGNEGYSYDMVGLKEVWAEGYTGQGMLVAVLDSGLDLQWSAWGYNELGVRRVHPAFSDDSFLHNGDKEAFVRITSDSLALFLKNHQLVATTGASGDKIVYDQNALYKTAKVPFAYDYAGYVDEYGDVQGGDVNVFPGESGSEHGTHVSGTIAGYAATEEGEVLFTGVAPDAQILMMKVFPDAGGGAPESAIVNALEDAMVLGADVVNLSLGSDNGYAHDDTAQEEVFEKVKAAGIVVMTSAGNSNTSTYGNNRDDRNKTSDPDVSMISSPAVYDTNLAVASINSTVRGESTLVWNDGTEDHTIAFADPFDVAMKSKFGDENEEIEIIAVDGTGTYDDYYNAGFRQGSSYGGKTGIALVKRGSLSFADKINNAMSFAWSEWQYDYMTNTYTQVTGGVLAVIIYDNDPEATELISMGADGTGLTSCFISGVDGAAMAAAIAAGKTVTLKTVNQEDRLSAWTAGGEMSEFTSWGSGPSLELKPEITAPGGNIWSALFDQTFSPADPTGVYDDYEGSYGFMSGTSMAAPHMTGLAALVEQYVRTGLKQPGAEAADLTNQLLVSTAVPQTDGNGVFYSPRRQGAGLVNAAAAIRTPVYISVQDELVGKLELGDDPEWTGSYELEFRVENLTSEARTYQATAYVLRPDTEDGMVLEQDVLLKTVDLEEVTVPAAGTTVRKTLSLTEEEIRTLRDLFPNGTYVEGFVVLTDAAGVNPQIGLPFLAFLGDWTAAPIFDSAFWFDAPEDGESVWNNDCTWGVSVVGTNVYSNGEVINFLDLGQNVYEKAYNFVQTEYHQENFTISPDGNGYFDVIDNVILYQLRDARLMVAEVRDEETGELYFRDFATYNTRSLYYADFDAPIASTLFRFTEHNWDGTDLDGNVLPSGTRCVYTITAYGDGDYGTEIYNSEVGRDVTDFESFVDGKEPTFNGHRMDKTGDVVSFKVLVDTQAPKLENNAVTFYEEEGRTYMTGTIEDDGSIAFVEVLPLVSRESYNYSTGQYETEYMADPYNPFLSETIYDAAAGTYSFTADVTAYVGYYAWTGNVYLTCGDYGGNDRMYAIKVDPTEGLALSQTSALLHPGDEFDLSVNNNTGSDALITRTSSNPEVATVDEFGHIVALTPGQTVITVSNGTDTVLCVVAVEERPTEVLDFDLSLAHFDGMKPDGSLVVKVVNLEPADVEIRENRWEVYEDNEELYTGLLTCGKYDADGLSAEIYPLQSTNTEFPIPGGEGHLDVTINGVKRTMTFNWEDLYTSSTQDGLISEISFDGEQTVYVKAGETATLVAKYRQPHSYIPVELYTTEGFDPNGGVYPKTPSAGLVLDGPAFANNGKEWTGKLVNLEGYDLPKSIQIYTGADYGYGYNEQALYGGYYTYDPDTGEIFVQYAPSGANNTMVIRADGVSNPNAEAGTLSGIEYVQPDSTYGPFDWSVTEGKEANGTLTPFEGESINYTVKNGAYFTPDGPGVSYLTATSKDGNYSLNFAVICEPVQAEALEPETHKLTMNAGDTETLTITLRPAPTLEEDEALIWKSFNPDVADVDENGVITAKSAGYAFIKISLKSNTKVFTYCIVEVTGSGSTEPDPDKPFWPSWPSWPILPGAGAGSGSAVTKPAESMNFSDVHVGDAFYDAVKYVYEEGLMNGTGSGKFSPASTLTRAMVVTILYRIEGEPAARYNGMFPDVANYQWYTEAVEWAARNNIVTGYTTGKFGPEDPVTREQLAAILYRYAQSKGSVLPDGADLTAYADGANVSPYAVSAVKWAVAEGILEAQSGKLQPRDAANRAQVAVAVAAFHQKYVK